MVSVIDKQGKAITDLKKDDFRARLRGQAVSVVDARYSLAPRRVIVLMDVSGSMGLKDPTAKWQIAREALNDLLEQTPRDVPIAMLSFAGEVRDVIDFSRGRDAIKGWLKTPPVTPPGGKGLTALFDAIGAALKMLQPFQAGDAIYTVTDGGDNRSRIAIHQLRGILLASHVRLFAFFFAEMIPGAVGFEVEGKDDFVDLVQQSGGFLFGASGHQLANSGPSIFAYSNDTNFQRTLVAQTQLLNTLIHGFWTVQLVVPTLTHDTKLQIRVINAAGQGREDVDCIYPRILPAHPS